jgi:hypothetical protein
MSAPTLEIVQRTAAQVVGQFEMGQSNQPYLEKNQNSTANKTMQMIQARTFMVSRFGSSGSIDRNTRRLPRH